MDTYNFLLGILMIKMNIFNKFTMYYSNTTWDHSSMDPKK